MAYQDPTEPTDIFWLLSLLDRPRNALATAVQEGLGSDPEESVLGGFWRGLTGQKETSWGDVLGIRRPESEDDWGTYLGLGAAHLGLNFALDPLLGIGKLKLPAQALKLKAVRDATDWLSGTPLWKQIGHGAIGREADNAAIYEKIFQSREIPNRAAREYERIASGLQPLNSRQLRELSEAYETGGRTVSGINPAKMLQPLSDIDRATTEATNALLQKLGLPVRGMIGDEPGTLGNIQQYLPHVRTRKGEDALDILFGKKSIGPGIPAKPLESRQLYRIVDETGLDVGEKPLVTKLTGDFMKKYGIKNTEEGLMLGGKRIEAVLPTIEEIYKSGVLGEGAFIENPGLAFLSSIEKKVGRKNFFEMIDEHLTQGKLTDIREFGGMPIGQRALRVTGLEHLAAEPWLANMVENAAQIALNPKTALGGLEKAMKEVNDSVLGRFVGRFGDLWKRSTLAHAGWLSGNLASNQVLVGLATGFSKVPLRDAQAISVARGAGHTISEIPNEMLREFWTDSGLLRRTSWGAEEATTELARATRSRISEAITGKMGVAGKGIQRAIDTGEAVQDFVFKLGGTIEDNSRLAVAIDYVLKNLPPGEVIRDVKEIAPLLKEAARHSVNFLNDYSHLAPFENMLKTWAPFYSWHRFMIARTIKTLGQDPAKMGQLGRLIDFTFDPMSRQQEAVSPDWMKTQGPAVGVLGHKFETTSGLPGVALTGRFQPFQNVEELIRRPGEFLSGIVTPAVKAPIEAAFNWNAFKNRPTDPIAKSPLDALLGPITGAPHGLDTTPFLGMNVPAGPAHVAGYLPFARYARELNTILGGNVGENEPTAMSPAEKAVWFLTGGKTFPFDEARQAQRKRVEAAKSLTAIKSQMNYFTKRGNTEAAEFYRQQWQQALMRNIGLLE